MTLMRVMMCVYNDSQLRAEGRHAAKSGLLSCLIHCLTTEASKGCSTQLFRFNNRTQLALHYVEPLQQSKAPDSLPDNRSF